MTKIEKAIHAFTLRANFLRFSLTYIWPAPKFFQKPKSSSSGTRMLSLRLFGEKSVKMVPESFIEA